MHHARDRCQRGPTTYIRPEMARAGEWNCEVCQHPPLNSEMGSWHRITAREAGLIRSAYVEHTGYIQAEVGETYHNRSHSSMHITIINDITNTEKA